MKDKIKYSAGLWIFAGCLDRFCPSYSDFLNTEEQIEAAAKVKGLKGLEVIYPWHFEGKKPRELKRQVEDKGLKIISVNPNIWADKKFKHGALSSHSTRVRKEAIALCKKTIDVAREIGCGGMCLWPGQDGFDYPMQADYRDMWKWETEGIREVAEYGKEMKIAVEFKLKEPRIHILAGSAALLIVLAQDVGLPNVGATLDFGHSLLARENPAQAAVLLNQHGRLFNVHMNDATGEWDDDMLVGSVHILETMEFLYYLKEIRYDGWISMDITPYREDASRACQLCIDVIKRLSDVVAGICPEQVKNLQSTMDAVQTQYFLHKLLLK